LSIKKLHYKNKLKKIKLLITDVDGVLTDGGRYYNEKGEVMKKFHNVDGMGVNILLRKGIKTVILTKEKSKIIFKWAKDMNVSKVFSGSVQKEKTLKIILARYDVKETECAYIGDDINDVNVLKNVGFAACPSDANMSVLSIVDYICNKKGGHGAFREISDLILKTQFAKDEISYNPKP